MKKRTGLLAVMILTAVLAKAQYVPTKADLDQFLNTKTLVVKDKYPLNMYDGEIEDAMEAEWDITEWEMIPYDQFEEKRQDSNYSFLFLSTVVFEKDKLQAKYKFLNVSLGGDYFNINQMPDLVSVPVAYASVEDESYTYNLGILVRFIHNHQIPGHTGQSRAHIGLASKRQRRDQPRRFQPDLPVRTQLLSVHYLKGDQELFLQFTLPLHSQ